MIRHALAHAAWQSAQMGINAARMQAEARLRRRALTDLAATALIAAALAATLILIATLPATVQTHAAEGLTQGVRR